MSVAQAWQEQALCAGTDTADFFPASWEHRKAKRAKTLCQGCPVVNECAEDAIPDRHRCGIWGGMSERDREAARAERAKEAKAA